MDENSNYSLISAMNSHTELSDSVKELPLNKTKNYKPSILELVLFIIASNKEVQCSKSA